MTKQPGAPRGRMLLYLAAAVLVRLADEGARVALLLLALERTGSAGRGGVLVAALLVPHVVAAPVVGLLTDRARRPGRVLAVAAVGFAACLATAALGLGRLPFGLVLAVLLVGGCCGPALTGGVTSQLQTLVAPAALPRAYGFDSLTYNTAGVAGPALAAVLATALSAAGATWVLAAAAAVSALLLAGLPLGSRRTNTARPAVTAGVTVMLREPVLAKVTLATSLAQLGGGALPVVIAVLTARQHHPSATGWLLTAVAAGGLVGSLLWTWRPVRAERAGLVVMVSLLGVGLPLVAAAGLRSLPGLAVLLAVSGAFLGPLTGALFTVRQQHAPEELRASVFTLGAGVKMSCAAAGAALAGVFAGLPTTTLLLGVGAAPLVAGGFGLLGLRALGPRQPPVRARAAGAAAPSA
ncbi:MFS transporter [uncultured Friedmanniella sp.]|uniref:MFS transporter n=1 Tax=uncultured Friedmanniella sp. TaxID=335381 RepID=UPI0035CBF123